MASKRKRQKVDSSVAEVWKPTKEGESLEGTFLGKEFIKGKGSRDGFTSYHFLTDPTDADPKGKRYRVASAMLNSKMNQIPKGAYVWLTYVGQFETDNGKSNNFDVEVAEGTELLDPLQESPTVDD